MFESGAALFIVAAGAACIVAITLFAAARVRRTNATVSKLVDLALGGRADEARIQARNASAELAPLLEALGGELAVPRPRRSVLELLLLALVPAPVLALSAYGWTALHGAQDTKLAVARGLLLGVAILLPLTLAGAHAVLVIGSWGRRSIRAACITLLAKSVKAAVDAETVEALRRGTNLRDREESNVAAVLFLVAFAAELVLLAGVVITAIHERSALARLVRASSDAERMKDVAIQLPSAYRAPATAFAGELARKAPLDEALAQTIAKIANTTFGPPPMVRVLGGLAISALLLAPLGIGLVESARSIDEAAASTQGMAGSRVFLEARDRLEPAFDALRVAFELSALLVAGLAVIVALQWWLNRSEVREARFLKALIEAAMSARPSAAAPVSARLSQLLAPERSLQVPVLAFAFFMVALVTGWTLLWGTAGVREANAGSLYDVWPAEGRAPLKSPAGMVVPSFAGGGSPVRERSLATLAIGPQRVDAAGDVLADLDARYALPDKFPQGANDVTKTMAGFKRQGTLDMNLLGHASVPMRTIVAVLDHLSTQGLRRVSCILERGMGGTDKLSRIPAGLWLELALPENVQPVLTLAVEATSVVVDPGATDSLAVERDDPRWRQRLGEIVRVRSAAKRGDGSALVVAVKLVTAELQYDRFLEILSSADSTCTTAADCGVPGLGLHFFLQR